MSRAITADLVYPGNSKSIPKGVVEFSENGSIEHIGKSPSGRIKNVEKLKGVICPGFINTHCHLELSHLKDELQQKTGLSGFIQNLQKVRQSSDDFVEKAMKAADEQMKENGIVAVGDISNSDVSFNTKKQSSLFYHSFIELFGFDKKQADKLFLKGKMLEEKLREILLLGNVTPHSPYSVSFELMEKIAGEKNNMPLSIHNQETEEENKMYLRKEGKIMEMLHAFQLDTSEWIASKTSSLQAYLQKLPKSRNLLLVHNTYTSKEDVQWAENFHPHLYWCFCPKANLFIEGKLPAINVFDELNVKCTLGTDSLASNDSLSILEEMKCIQRNFPSISLSTLIQWASYNGAEFFGLENNKGSIEVGKKPGILLLEGVENDVLKIGSLVSRID